MNYIEQAEQANVGPYIWGGNRKVMLTAPGLHTKGNFPEIELVARSLSFINRYTGHTLRPISVAEHSLLVVAIANHLFGDLPDLERAEVLLACLMHDAHEAFTGDISTPLKRILGNTVKQFEAEVERALWVDYGIEDLMDKHKQRVKLCDLTALAIEKRDLLPDSGDWPILNGIETIPGVQLQVSQYPVPASIAALFVEGYNELQGILAKLS